MSAYKKLVVTNIIEETKDCKTIQLQVMEGQPVHYEAGQFLTFIFPKEASEEEKKFIPFQQRLY